MIKVDFINRWKSAKLFTIFIENKEKNSSFSNDHALQFYFGSIIPKKKYELTDELIDIYKKYTIVRPCDIVINGLNLNYDFVTQRIGLVTEQGIITSAYISLRCRQNFNALYYCYLFKVLDAQKLFHGMGTGIRLTLSYNELKYLELPVPPRDEQEQIVRFLDWKVSEINKLINIRRKEIKELEALKRSVINHTVTQGLNPNVSKKYSGVKWLGDIPAHWSIVKLRKILHPISIKNRPDLPLLSVVREQGVILRNVNDKETNHNFIPDDLSSYKVVKKAQFAMNKMKAWQGSYGVSNYTGIVSPAYFIFDIDFNNLEYFHYAIRSKVYVNFFAQASDGIRVGQWDLDIHKMKEIPFIVPPEAEQIAIVDYINNVLPKYEIAIKKLAVKINLLEEVKTRLIADVVTGKIDVRGIKVPDYEFVAETADSDIDYNEDDEASEEN